MLRSIYLAAACAAVTAVVSQGCNRGGVGDPCIPEQEFDAQFSGFDPGEVNVESRSFQCLTRLCLVNHFRGRVTCPYGQSCTTPGDNGNVVANVQPQCTDRTASDAVYCSCRCANADGRTDDGANYCACPDQYDCAQLVVPIGLKDQNLVGGYCIKRGTEYNPASACTLSCDPNVPSQNCPPSSIL
jgi:hypothetical protein